MMVKFFFQAEGGIRGRDVTGVQTCALPSSSLVYTLPTEGPFCYGCPPETADGPAETMLEWHWAPGRVKVRSEERRVGKHHRIRLRKCHSKKNTGKHHYTRVIHNTQSKQLQT